MTGHQNNPTNGRDIHGNPAPKLDLEAFCKAMGIKHVVVVDPFDLKELERVVKEETSRDELSVIISRRPCALIVKQPGIPYFSDPEPVSYTHLRAHETVLDLVCRLLLEKKKQNHISYANE